MPQIDSGYFKRNQEKQRDCVSSKKRKKLNDLSSKPKPSKNIKSAQLVPGNHHARQ